MRAAVIWTAVLVFSEAKPNGFYHQQYNYQTSDSSYKNDELQHKNENQGFYSKDGDLEGRVRPKINTHNEHSEYVNPRTREEYVRPQTTSFGQLNAQNRFKSGEGLFEGTGMDQTAGVGYSGRQGYSTGYQVNSGSQAYGGINSELREVTQNLEDEIAREMQRAVYEQHRRSSGFSSSLSQSQIERDREALREELKRNVTMRMQDALKTHYGSQGIRGGYSYSMVNGRLQPSANYNNQELTDLTNSIEANLERQLQQQIQSHYHTQVHSSQVRTHQTMGDAYQPMRYPSPIQQGPIQHRPIQHGPTQYEPIHQLPVQQGPIHQGPSFRPAEYPREDVQFVQTRDSITTVATRVQNDLNEHLNRILDTTQKRYFTGPFQNAQVNYEQILSSLQQELRANISLQFDNQLRHSGYVGQINNGNDLENLRRQIESNLITKLNRDFNKQRERYFETYSSSQHSSQQYHNHQPMVMAPVYSASNQNYEVDMASTQRQLQENLSRQLQEALTQNQYRQSHLYSTSSNFNPQDNYQATLQQLSAELNRNLTRQMEQFNMNSGYQQRNNGQVESIKNQLQNNLMSQLQQGLQQTYSRYSSWSSSSSSSSNNNYRPVRGFGNNAYQTQSYNDGRDSNVMNDDCMLGDDPLAYQTQTSDQDDDLTQQVQTIEDIDESSQIPPGATNTSESQDLSQQVQSFDENDDSIQSVQNLNAPSNSHGLIQQIQSFDEKDDLIQSSQSLTSPANSQNLTQDQSFDNNNKLQQITNKLIKPSDVAQHGQTLEDNDDLQKSIQQLTYGPDNTNVEHTSTLKPISKQLTQFNPNGDSNDLLQSAHKQYPVNINVNHKTDNSELSNQYDLELQRKQRENQGTNQNTLNNYSKHLGNNKNIETVPKVSTLNNLGSSTYNPVQREVTPIEKVSDSTNYGSLPNPSLSNHFQFSSYNPAQREINPSGVVGQRVNYYEGFNSNHKPSPSASNQRIPQTYQYYVPQYQSPRQYVPNLHITGGYQVPNQPSGTQQYIPQSSSNLPLYAYNYQAGNINSGSHNIPTSAGKHQVAQETEDFNLGQTTEDLNPFEPTLAQAHQVDNIKPFRQSYSQQTLDDSYGKTNPTRESYANILQNGNLHPQISHTLQQTSNEKDISQKAFPSDISQQPQDRNDLKSSIPVEQFGQNQLQNIPNFSNQKPLEIYQNPVNVNNQELSGDLSQLTEGIENVQTEPIKAFSNLDSTKPIETNNIRQNSPLDIGLKQQQQDVTFPNLKTNGGQHAEDVALSSSSIALQQNTPKSQDFIAQEVAENQQHLPFNQPREQQLSSANAQSYQLLDYLKTINQNQQPQRSYANPNYVQQSYSDNQQTPIYNGQQILTSQYVPQPVYTDFNGQQVQVGTTRHSSPYNQQIQPHQSTEEGIPQSSNYGVSVAPNESPKQIKPIPANQVVVPKSSNEGQLLTNSTPEDKLDTDTTSGSYHSNANIGERKPLAQEIFNGKVESLNPIIDSPKLVKGGLIKNEATATENAIDFEVNTTLKPGFWTRVGNGVRNKAQQFKEKIG